MVPFFALTWNGELSQTSVHVCLGGDRWRELTAAEVLDTFEVIA